MDENALSAAAGILISLLFSYVPGLRKKYNSMEPEYKSLIMGVVLLIVAGCIYAFVCLGWSEILGITTIACDKTGALQLLKLFVYALIANQTIYQISDPIATKIYGK